MLTSAQLRSIQDSMSTREKAHKNCFATRLLEVSPRCLSSSSSVRPTDDGQGRSSSAFASYAIDGVMSLALCPQVVSQAPQHFRPFETQATYDGCFARQSICSVSSLQSGTARLGHYVHRSLRRCMSSIDTIMQSGLSTLTRPEALSSFLLCVGCFPPNFVRAVYWFLAHCSFVSHWSLPIRIRIAIFIVPVQVYRDICLTVHSRKLSKQ